MMHSKLGCVLLQKDSISDAKWRLDQWQEPTRRVEPMKLMNAILADVHGLRLATTDSQELAVFTTSMKLFMYLAPADIGKYVASHLWQYSRPSSAQVYLQSPQLQQAAAHLSRSHFATMVATNPFTDGIALAGTVLAAKMPNAYGCKSVQEHLLLVVALF